MDALALILFPSAPDTISVTRTEDVSLLVTFSVTVVLLQLTCVVVSVTAPVTSSVLTSVVTPGALLGTGVQVFPGVLLGTGIYEELPEDELYF